MFLKSEEQELFQELRSLSERLAEDKIYERVMMELENDQLDAVAKAKAFEEAEGDSQKARALYIKHRVRRIRDLALQYEIWVAQEKARNERMEKEAQDRMRIRKMLTEKIRMGEMPPKEIQNRYRADFLVFYSEWTVQDYARKYLPKYSAWREFLLKANLID